MNNIKVLDCTLRDGGYINEWNFGSYIASDIINLLLKSGIDYIETGFITKEPTTSEKTLFNSFEEIKRFLPKHSDKEKLLGMIKYENFPINEVPIVQNSPIKGIRVIFKKFQRTLALEYCKQIKDKGYKLFINPTFTDQYTQEELFQLLEEINKINPYAMSVVDSMGVFKESDLTELFKIIDEKLNKDIAFCFHSHNNLLLSFSNAKHLIKICKIREIIIDSTVFGIGRGAGNLPSEKITRYINDNFFGNYNLIPLLQISDKYINPIFNETSWGYSLTYYLAAINHCHPNYAKFLSDKKISPEKTEEILKNIPLKYKAIYNEDLILKIYKNYKYT